ncbi:aspartic peptidase domain-containing protein [Chaetomidium leptoderma]|uniref:Aspartic peptidase domain-containing protein n=1 Tax=Chaetomidium leptoderma TaxID=669021 RepID=A0AAN6VMX4_9PEZI|nr:aspartic peptidase domain-containing protein [Chaetomidium leptoderma]
MLGNAAPWILLLVAACRGVALPSLPPPAGGGVGPLRKPGYVRMPVSRHQFKGKGKGKGKGYRGWHWSPPPGSPGSPPPPTSLTTVITESTPTQTSLVPATAQPLAPRQYQNDQRWGWSSLEELGGIAYIIQLEIGTPPQKIKVFIDTGSYELWVNPKCSTSASQSICQSHGNYYPNKSYSSSYVGGEFAITYGTGAVRGSYWSDVMSIASSNYTFSGILGLGYTYPYSINYPSVLNLMVSQMMIMAPIFSLGLGGDQDNFSEIIFGGVNRWKFAGALEPVSIWPPISQQNPRWIQYWVNVTSVGMTKPNERAVIYTDRDTFTMTILIDTGSTLSYLREDLVAQIGQQFHATIDSGGNYIVDCAWRDEPGTVDFGFNRGRMVINVSYKDFIYQQYPGHCMLGVQPADAGSTSYVLGDTFIRGAYLVFDQESDIVWMNQYYNCGDGVITVGETKADTKYIIFIPTFPPVTTGKPACNVLSSPLPPCCSSNRLTQNTAFPSTGRNTKNELTRFPPSAGAACSRAAAAPLNQSVWKCCSGSRWVRAAVLSSWPWKESARDSMQDTTASEGGRVVDWEVRRVVVVLEWEVMPLRVKVDSLVRVIDGGNNRHKA